MNSRSTHSIGWQLPAVLLILALASAGCSGLAATGAGAAPAEKPLVQTAPTPTAIVVSTPAPVTSSSNLSTVAGQIYNGEIVPEKIVPIIAEIAGRVVELNVAVGDDVTADEVLMRTDSTVAEAQHALALAMLDQAQAALDLATAPPSETDLAALNATVSAAEAAYQKALSGATDEEKRAVLAQLRQAEAAVKVYQAQYDNIAGNPWAAMMPESLQLEQATLSQEAAQAQYDKVLKGATPDQIAGVYAQLQGAKSQLAALKTGAKPAQIAAIQAQVKQAEVNVYLAQLQVDKTSVISPIDGFVYQLSTTAGAMSGPTTPVMVLFSHDMKLQFSVEESRLTSLSSGQPVRIQVDAYPDRTFTGEISTIAPTLDPATRTVQVTVHPTGADAHDLKMGMFATIELLEP